MTTDSDTSTGAARETITKCSRDPERTREEIVEVASLRALPGTGA